MQENPIAFLSLVKHLEETVGAKTGYALLDPFPCQTLRNGRPEIVAIQNAGKMIARHIGLDEYIFIIAVTSQKPNTAGHIELERSSRDVFVELSPDVCEYKDAVLAVLCHELAHKFLHKYGITIGATTLEQEFLTDVTAVYLGLGKIMLSGCECRRSKQRAQYGKRFTETHVLKTGYLSRDCFAFVYRLVCAMRGIPPQSFRSSLSPAAQEALHSIEAKYATWFIPEFRTADGVAKLAEDHKRIVETCQDDAAARHRALRIIEQRLGFIRTRMNDSHKPLQEAQQLIARLANPEPNPHLTVLNCLQTRESIAGLLCARELQVKDVFLGWKQVEAMASWGPKTGPENCNQIVECPLDGKKLRVPMGSKRLLVTCPDCKYKFIVNTDHYGRVDNLGEKQPWKSRRRLGVIVASAICLDIALLFVAFNVGRSRDQSDSALRHPAAPPQKADPWKVVSEESDPEAKLGPSPAKPVQTEQPQPAAPSKRERKSVVEPANGDFELNQPPNAPIRSLPTGTRLIEDRATTGHGELEIVNGTKYDASLVVMDAGTQLQVRKVYIKTQDSLTLEHIASGNYSVFFETGEDWDESTEDSRVIVVLISQPAPSSIHHMPRLPMFRPSDERGRKDPGVQQRCLRLL